MQRGSRRFQDFGVSDQIQVIVRAEHQHLAIAHADLSGAAAFVLAEDLEVHIKSGRL